MKNNENLATHSRRGRIITLVICLLLISFPLYFLFFGDRGQFYESHSFPNKPSIEIRVFPSFPDSSFFAYLVDGRHKTKLFEVPYNRTLSGDSNETNATIRTYQGKCHVCPDHQQMYEVFWSGDGQKVAISYRGFYVAAYDLKTGEHVKYGSSLQDSDKKVETFLRK